MNKRENKASDKELDKKKDRFRAFLNAVSGKASDNINEVFENYMQNPKNKEPKIEVKEDA